MRRGRNIPLPASRPFPSRGRGVFPLPASGLVPPAAGRFPASCGRGTSPPLKPGRFPVSCSRGTSPSLKPGLVPPASRPFPFCGRGLPLPMAGWCKNRSGPDAAGLGGRIPAPPCLSDGRRCGATPSGPSVRRCSAARRRRGCPRRARRGWWCGCRGPSARRGSGASPRRRARRRATRGCGGSG